MGFGSSSCELRTKLDFLWLKGFRKDPDMTRIYLLPTSDVGDLKHLYFDARVTSAHVLEFEEVISMKFSREFFHLCCR